MVTKIIDIALPRTKERRKIRRLSKEERAERLISVLLDGGIIDTALRKTAPLILTFTLLYIIAHVIVSLVR